MDNNQASTAPAPAQKPRAIQVRLSPEDEAVVHAWRRQQAGIPSISDTLREAVQRLRRDLTGPGQSAAA
jgi:hypothetical protein